MEDEKTQQIFDVMGKLQKNFDENCKEGISSPYRDTVVAENFEATFEQVYAGDPSLREGENFAASGGTASVTNDVKFKVRIRPTGIPDAEPLRIEVDNPHRSGSNRIIHVNAPEGWRRDVPQDLIHQTNPTYPVDLVAISGADIFREAVDKSLTVWGLK